MLFFVLMALIFMAYGVLSFIDATDLIHWLSQHHELNAEKSSTLGVYVNASAWFKMKAVLVIAFVFLIYLFFYDRMMMKETKLAIIAYGSLIKKEILILSIKERTSLFGLLILFSLVLITYSYFTPIQLDELHTWLYFIDRGALVTASYYPASNNHIAYNLLSVLPNLFLPPLWSVRIVSLFSAISAAFLFFIILRQRYTVALSIAGMLLLMTAAPFAWYGVQGRGYVLELTGLLIILYLLVQSRYDANTDRLLVLWNVFTLYIIPVAAIPLALLNLFYAYRLLKEDGNNFHRIIRTAIYSFVGVFLCYAPVGIFSGFESLINNPFVQRVAYNETWMIGLTSYMPGIWNFISGCSGIFSLVLVIVLGLSSILFGLMKNKLALLPLAVLAIPYLLLQVYPVLLFERTWLWLVVPFIWWVIEVTHVFASIKQTGTFIVAGCIILLIMISNLLRLYSSNTILVRDSERFMEIKQVIEKEAAGKTVLVLNDVNYEYLLFYQKKAKNYTLLYDNNPSEIRADLVLKSTQDFDDSEGAVLWMDNKDVLYVAK
ncbi:MAG: hypothetical protein K0R51_1733 [Cytophagaceae bacterium]|nr:hypothetical protein [Cytophagaceae bacterium]